MYGANENKNKMTIRIHSYLKNSLAEGPYVRFVIWVQGCSIRCQGCANKHMWDFNGGQELSVTEMYAIIRRQKGIEGITLVGGEPFDQAKPLAELAYEVKNIGLGIVTFTGYHYEYLLENGTQYNQSLIEYTDLLIDGPYQQDKKTMNLPWVGSRNQRYIHLSERYLKFDFAAVRNKTEIRLNEACSKITFNGISDNGIMANFGDRMRKKGFIREVR
jgi:anaerobic ribonucleoside-triphosphate reductase activating protein